MGYQKPHEVFSEVSVIEPVVVPTGSTIDVPITAHEELLHLGRLTRVRTETLSLMRRVL